MLDKTTTDFRSGLDSYFSTLADLLKSAEATDGAKRKIALGEGCEWFCRAAHETHNSGNKIMFVGNGGSAGICSHLAVDFSKNGGLRAMAFNDPSALTCLGNSMPSKRRERPLAGSSPFQALPKTTICVRPATSIFLCNRKNMDLWRWPIWPYATPCLISTWAGAKKPSAG
jgi:hypothetical protein